jgi:tRNA wybutosine-synthesizing protein 4
MSEVEGVQSTSNDALKTKISCVLCNYYQDPFILYMEPGVNHKKFLPLMNRGTYCRVYAINSKLHEILDNRKKLEEFKDSKINIIILGSGFDTTYFNLMAEGYTNIEVYEYDYKNIIEKKLKYISKYKQLSEIVKTNKNNYHLIDCDITNKKLFSESLNKIQNNENDLTIVICECLLVYIDKEITVEMLSSINERFSNVYILEYDLIGPDDPFGKEMVDNLKNRNINLRGFNEVKNIDDQINRLKEAKFEDINIVDMYYVYFKLLPIQERRRIERLELMDEFEELNLLQRHACFGYASKCKNDKFKGLINKM